MCIACRAESMVLPAHTSAELTLIRGTAMLPALQDLVQLQDWLTCKLDTMTRDLMFSQEQLMNQQELGQPPHTLAMHSPCHWVPLILPCAAARDLQLQSSLHGLLPRLRCCRQLQHRDQCN